MSSRSLPKAVRVLALSFALLLSLSFLAAPASAGAVYVPIVQSSTGGVNFQPRVLVGNAASAKRTVTQFHIPQFQSGLARTPGPQLFEVPAGDSQIASVPNQIGLVELSGAEDVMVWATMVGQGPQGEVVRLPLPAITSGVAMPKDGVLHLKDLRRSASTTTNIYLVNLKHGATECAVRLLDPTGKSLLNATSIALQPLSMAPFIDALVVLGSSTPAARAEVSCDGLFYAFATVHESAPSGLREASTILPAGTGASTLPFPGTGGPTNPPPPPPPVPGACTGSGATHCYHRAGLFFAPSKANGNQKRATFPVPAGAYGKARLRMEVLYGGINPKNPGGRQQFFWMAINGRNMDLLGFASTKNNNGQLMLRAGIGTLPDKKSKVEISQSLVVGKTYLLDYVYDPRGGSSVWNVIDRATGQLVASIADRPNVGNIHFGDDGHMAVDVSFNGSDREEPPSYKWTYSELVFEIWN